MNRRGFLSLLAPAAALIVAPELLLPKRTFFLPPVGGWGDTGLTVAKLQHMKALLRAAELAVDPPVMFAIDEAWCDFMAFGTAAFKIEPGGVHWVPIHQLKQFT